MPPRRVNAFREPLDAISRLLTQSGLFFVCGLMLKHGCQHARNCADADRRQFGQEPPMGICEVILNVRDWSLYWGVIPIASVISSFAWM
jgi:hypothetical protein